MGTVICKELHSLVNIYAQKQAIKKQCTKDFTLQLYIKVCRIKQCLHVFQCNLISSPCSITNQLNSIGEKTLILHIKLVPVNIPSIRVFYHPFAPMPLQLSQSLSHARINIYNTCQSWDLTSNYEPSSHCSSIIILFQFYVCLWVVFHSARCGAAPFGKKKYDKGFTFQGGRMLH